MIFSLDAAISFVIMLMCTLVFASVLAGNITQSKENIESFELEEKALMIADSLVKNYDQNNTTLGACIIDADKKRVLTNQISLANLLLAKKLIFEGIFVESITVKTKNLNKTIKLENSNFETCISAKRFALIDGESATVEVKTCRTN
ncbi:MAG: hypothetical protein WCI04_05465 [archaeon]